jgi:UDP-glucose 4-epimerase
MCIPRIFSRLFSKVKTKNINNFIVKNTITRWKKSKQIPQEPISIHKNNPYGTIIG